MGGGHSIVYVDITHQITPKRFTSKLNGNPDETRADFPFEASTDDQTRWEPITIILHPRVTYQNCFEFFVNSADLTCMKQVLCIKDRNDPIDRRDVEDIPLPINGKPPYASLKSTLMFKTEVRINDISRATALPYLHTHQYGPFAPTEYGPETHTAVWVYLCDQDENVMSYYYTDRVVSEKYGILNRNIFTVTSKDAPVITSRVAKLEKSAQGGLMQSVSSGFGAAAELIHNYGLGMARQISSQNINASGYGGLSSDNSGPSSGQSSVRTSMPLSASKTGNEKLRSPRHLPTLPLSSSSSSPEHLSPRSTSSSLSSSPSITTPLYISILLDRRFSFSLLEVLAVLLAIGAMMWSLAATVYSQDILLHHCLDSCPHVQRVIPLNPDPTNVQ
eukprot:CFRG8250T1